MDFLELLETIQTERASMETLFGDAGRGVRSGAKGPTYQAKLAEAANLIAGVLEGRKPAYLLREAMTTSDFPYLFGDILDRQLLANYREWPSVWRTYCKMSTVPDFRAVKRFSLYGAQSVLDEVSEQGTYPQSKILENTPFTFSVKKYGRRIPFSWESMINDDLSALRDIPERFGRAARRSEDKFATELHVDANGPHATVYTALRGNLITGNPVLSVAGLQAAFTAMAGMVDEEGEPIIIDMVTLEVPPALEITARNILNATQLYVGAVGDNQLVAENWMRSKVSLVVNPYIPIVASTANGSTCWFMHAAPSNGRPAFEMGFLTGHAEPEIFIKSPNQQRVGGGVNPMDGDFDTDSIEYKVRHVFGGLAEDYKMTVASQGDGN